MVQGLGELNSSPFYEGGKAAYLNLPDGLTLGFIESPLISEELKSLTSRGVCLFG